MVIIDKVRKKQRGKEKSDKEDPMTGMRSRRRGCLPGLTMAKEA